MNPGESVDFQELLNSGYILCSSRVAQLLVGPTTWMPCVQVFLCNEYCIAGRIRGRAEASRQ